MTEFMQDSSKKQCVVELKRDLCSACYTNGRVFEIIAAKMKKHGYKTDFYRVTGATNQNVLKYTGLINYTPVYIYMKKTMCGKHISEIFTLPPPAQNHKKFIRAL
jgi:hypothetical protein